MTPRNLLELLKVSGEDDPGVWEEHFKTTLLLLLETLETLGGRDVRTCPRSCDPPTPSTLSGRWC